jgi:hypothetical protein
MLKTEATVCLLGKVLFVGVVAAISKAKPVG